MVVAIQNLAPSKKKQEGEETKTWETAEGDVKRTKRGSSSSTTSEEER
jgi:hypothetical protein